jgi:hypothetical protein
MAASCFGLGNQRAVHATRFARLTAHEQAALLEGLTALLRQPQPTCNPARTAVQASVCTGAPGKKGG